MSLEITQSLRQRVAEHYGLSAGDSQKDTMIRSLAASMLKSGEITPSELATLSEGGTVTPSASGHGDISGLVKSAVDAQMMRFGVDNPIFPKKGSTMSPDELIAKAAQSASGNGPYVRLKSSSERYSTHKSAAIHPKTGAPAMFLGKPVEHASEWENAKAGALFKHLARRAGVSVRWSEADEAILLESVHKDCWNGTVGGEWRTGIPADEVKSVLNDATSGGVYITPTWFDDRVVVESLLYGELLPLVQVVDLERGLTVEGARMTTPGITWGHAEGAAQDLNTTAGLFSNLDTSIHAATASYLLGLDFLSDSAVSVGALLSSQLGLSLQADLDRCIAAGDGVNEPLGFINTSGATAVPSEGGTASAAPTVDDVLNLYFALEKQYRSSPHTPIFLMTDAGYKTFRAVPVGEADQRLVFGMTVGDYKMLDLPTRINNSDDMPVTTVCCCAADTYRLFRRKGLEIRFSTEGQTLMLSNQGLLVLRARYGGQPTLPAAVALMTDAPVSG